MNSFAETLVYQLGDPLWSRGNTGSKSIRLRELLKRCRVRLSALDEFQHFVEVRQANIPNDVADWLKEQVEEAKLTIVVLGLQRFLEVLRLRLSSLLSLIQFVGCAEGNKMLRWKQRRFASTDLATGTEIGKTATEVLRDWPRQPRAALGRMMPERVESAPDVNFRDVFGNFYRHLLRVLPRADFEFLQDAFEEFVVEGWNGVLRRNSRSFSRAIRGSTQWITTDEAEGTAHIVKGTILELVRTGDLEGFFIELGHRRECWIRRESLNQWIAARELELARYMCSLEAQHTLGRKHFTLLRVAQAGLIRHVKKGPERNFPIAYHFLREDVVKIKHAFEKHVVPTQEYSKAGDLIALRDAVKNYLGGDSGLPAAIQAVIDGVLIPVGRTTRSPGIKEYLFLSEDLRMYRPVSSIEVPAKGFLNYREAAAMLGTNTPVIRGLVAQGVLAAPVPYRNGFSKLVPAADVQRFSARYVATTVLAKRLNLDGSSFSRYLKESSIPLLSVSIPGEGWQAFFVLQEIAARLRIPSVVHSRGLILLRGCCR